VWRQVATAVAATTLLTILLLVVTVFSLKTHSITATDLFFVVTYPSILRGQILTCVLLWYARAPLACLLKLLCDSLLCT
jgi:hypothetical protein